MAALKSLATEEHWKFLAEFARWEIAAGGPDPHMVLICHLSQGLPVEDRAWLAGCYMGFYNAPAGLAMYTAWPWKTASSTLFGLEQWLTGYWPALPTRRERRTVRTPGKMAQYFWAYRQWVEWLAEDVHDLENYESLWSRLGEVYSVGRYAQFKILECLRRMDVIQVEMPDIRPVGAGSPRTVLSWLWPHHRGLLLDGKDREAIQQVNDLVTLTQERLQAEYNLALDLYTLEVVLCDYRQSLEGKRQYPGRSHDSELGYLERVQWEFPEVKTRLLQARREIFPRECLGEIQGWPGVRKELGAVLSTFGYTWSDLKFKYSGSMLNLGQPVLQATLKG